MNLFFLISGIINKFLSWKFFIPLGRLSYSAYILHFPVLWMRNGLRRKLLLFHHYEIVSISENFYVSSVCLLIFTNHECHLRFFQFYEFLATLVLILCLSVTFHLLFEAPFLNLEEAWFPKNGRKTKKLSESEATIVSVAKIKYWHFLFHLCVYCYAVDARVFHVL